MDPSSIARTADRARRATAARNSTNRWLVTRPVEGEGTTDPVSGDWSPPAPITFEVHAHFRLESRPYVRSRRDTPLTIEGPRLCVDACERPLREGDVVSQVCGGDPSLDGRTWRVIGEPGSSYRIHREYPLEEVRP